MSLCTRNRWTAGTSSTVKETQCSKEINDMLQKMNAERAKQDTMWSSVEQTASRSSYTEGNSNVNQAVQPGSAYHK